MKPVHPATAAPHGSTIDVVATTDEGDAAISADDLGGVRLWPSLDGQKAPIPIKGVRPVKLAIAHAGDDLVIGAIDAAGTAWRLELTRDGAVTARVQLPGDVRAERVAVVGKSVLVERADQSIDIHDGSTPHHLVAPTGEQLGDLAVRRGVAMALTGGDNGLRSLRTIELEGRWGKAVTLPEPAARFAIAPGHARVAVESAINSKVHVYELATMKELGSTPAPATANVTREFRLGFIDDDHLGVFGDVATWWSATSASADPWAQAVSGTQIARNDEQSDPSFGDGVAVSGSALVLELATPQKSRWLGYRDLPDQRASIAGEHLATAPTGMRTLWLDDDLRQMHVFDLAEHASELAPNSNNVTAIGDHAVIVSHMVDASSSSIAFDYVDTDHPKDHVALGAFTNLERFDFQDDTLLVFGNGKVERVRIEGGKPKRLAPLALDNGGTFRLTDPARANGVIAVSLYADDGGYHVATYKQGKDDTTAIKPERGPVINGYVFAFDRAGRRFVFTNAADMTFRIDDVDGKLVSKHLIKGASGVAAVNADGTMVAFIGDHEVIGVDAVRGERWRTPMWQPGTLTFTPDNRRLAIGTIAGFVVVDALTGTRTSMACGWGFGLWDTQPVARNFGQAPVCAE